MLPNLLLFLLCLLDNKTKIALYKLNFPSLNPPKRHSHTFNDLVQTTTNLANFIFYHFPQSLH